MPSIQVRDCPPDIYQKLVSSARQNHRSISQQIVATLEEQFSVAPSHGQAGRAINSAEQESTASSHGAYDASASNPLGRGYSSCDFSESQRQDAIRRRKEIFAKLDALPPIDIPEEFPSPEEIIREIRDSR